MHSLKKAMFVVIAVSVIGAISWLSAGLVDAQSPPEHIYEGANSCRTCHRSDGQGNQFGIWQGTAHANAYNALAEPDAQAIADERGLGNAQEAPECLRCHTTAYGVDAAFLGEDFDPTLGVQCESCHGPGSDYSAMRVMRSRDDAIAAGLIIPDEAVCTGCHNSDSPMFQGFVFDDRFAQIAHPTPSE